MMTLMLQKEIIVKIEHKNNSPNGSWEKIEGKTINNNPGPSAGSNPKAKTTGNIARPANNETKIFRPTTVLAEDVRLTSFFKYELYVTIQENPTASEKKDCPNAYNNDSPVIFEKSGDRKNLTPSIAPSSVNERTTRMIKKYEQKRHHIFICFLNPILDAQRNDKYIRECKCK